MNVGREPVFFGRCKSVALVIAPAMLFQKRKQKRERRKMSENGRIRKAVLCFLLVALLSITVFLFTGIVTANPGAIKLTVQSGSHTFNATLCYFSRGVTTCGWSFVQYPPPIVLQPGQEGSKIDDGGIMRRLAGIPLGLSMGYFMDNGAYHITIGPDPPLELGKWYTLPSNSPQDAQIKIEHIFDLECFKPGDIPESDGQCGIPTLDQHHNSSWKDNWCSPTSCAAALSWYALARGNSTQASYFNNLCPDYDGDHQQQYDWDDMYRLADVLGNQYFNTDPNWGTTKEAKYTGTKKYVTDQGYGDQVLVSYFKLPTLDDIKSNLDWGTLVQGDGCIFFSYKIAALGIRWTDSKGYSCGHVVVARAFNDTQNGDGSYNVGLMDPWTASSCNTVMKPTGEILYAGYWGFVEDMLTIANQNYPLPYYYLGGGGARWSTTSSYTEINGFVCAASGHNYIINANDFGDVRVIDGVVYGVPGGTVYNTTGTVYPYANGTVIIKDGTYFSVTGSVDIINGTQLDTEFRTTSGSVGGFENPVDKLTLLAPYLGLASTTTIAAVATAAYAKHVKRRKER